MLKSKITADQQRKGRGGNFLATGYGKRSKRNRYEMKKNTFGRTGRGTLNFLLQNERARDKGLGRQTPFGGGIKSYRKGKGGGMPLEK